KMLETLRNLLGEFNSIVLCSPDEESRFENSSIQPVVCDVETVFSVIRDADLLITGDTMVKHLAAATDTPVIELSLGSSAYQKTGVYKSGQVIIQSKESCAPCSHSTECVSSDFRCREKISPECVALVAQKILLGHYVDLRLIAKEFKDQCDIRGTAFSQSGEWYSYSFADGPSDRRFQEFLDRSSWKLFLNRGRPGELLPFGSESEFIIDQWITEFGTREPGWRPILNRLRTRVSDLIRDVEKIKDEFQDCSKGKVEGSAEFFENLKGFRQSLRGSKILGSYSVELDEAIEVNSLKSFVGMRKVQEGLKCIDERARIELKLIDTISENCVEAL
ncbi:MAG: hypothetical protein KDD25_04400, partial [Bdellovibrionales bacterium]|nr:hypothetical protein [Bdellovibrionales bacterium]